MLWPLAEAEAIGRLGRAVRPPGCAGAWPAASSVGTGSHWGAPPAAGLDRWLSYTCRFDCAGSIAFRDVSCIPVTCWVDLRFSEPHPLSTPRHHLNALTEYTSVVLGISSSTHISGMPDLPGNPDPDTARALLALACPSCPARRCGGGRPLDSWTPAPLALAARCSQCQACQRTPPGTSEHAREADGGAHASCCSYWLGTQGGWSFPRGVAGW